MKTGSPNLTLSALATGALTVNRFTNFAGAQAVATDVALGVANANYATGEQAGVQARGVLVVEAGAAVAQGAQVQPDASGRAITLAAGTAFGRALDAAAAAGDFIRVLA
ncbi:MAG TPA: DUF2190 family protein [Burkholderiaceae bacterium]|nr:DUF2190 family protein [Burkholderiaceae bacterium]